MKQLLAKFLVMAFSLHLFCMFMSEIPHRHAAEVSATHHHDSSEHHDPKKTLCAGCTDTVLSIVTTNIEKKDVPVLFALSPWIQEEVFSESVRAGEISFIPHAPPWSSQVEKILASTRLLL